MVRERNRTREKGSYKKMAGGSHLAHGELDLF